MERKEPNENTCLLYGRSIYEAIRINGSNGKQEDPESVNDDFRYCTIEPVWMNIRLCIFWFLWLLLIVVLVASILSYCCLQIQTCTNVRKMIASNATRA